MQCRRQYAEQLRIQQHALWGRQHQQQLGGPVSLGEAVGLITDLGVRGEGFDGAVGAYRHMQSGGDDPLGLPILVVVGLTWGLVA